MQRPLRLVARPINIRGAIQLNLRKGVNAGAKTVTAVAEGWTDGGSMHGL